MKRLRQLPTETGFYAVFFRGQPLYVGIGKPCQLVFPPTDHSGLSYRLFDCHLREGNGENWALWQVSGQQACLLQTLGVRDAQGS